MNTSKNQWLPWVILVVISLLWGSGPILIKRGLVVFSPGELSMLRIFSVAVFLLPLWLPKLKNLTLRDYKLLFISGLVGIFFPAILFAKAQTQVCSCISGVLNVFTPIFTLLSGKLFFQTTISKKKLLGTITGFLGALLIMCADLLDLGNLNYYMLLILLGTFFYGINLNMIKYYLQNLPSITITSVSIMLVGAISGIILFTQTEFIFKLQTVSGAYYAMGYTLLLGITGSAVAWILLNILVKRTSSVFASAVTLFAPMVALMWGILDGEVLLWTHYLGMIVIFGSVYLIK